MTDICWLRLDFESFTILGTGLTTESNGGLCLDTFKITVSSIFIHLIACTIKLGQTIDAIRIQPWIQIRQCPQNESKQILKYKDSDQGCAISSLLIII